MKNILITGGAGFIGSNLIRELIKQGSYRITVIDNFSNQIHGEIKSLSADIAENVDLIVGDVTDQDCFKKVLVDKDIIVHLAAETGTGQSMYDIKRYCDVNVSSTAILCDFLVNEKHKVKKVILASSRSIYGEGRYWSKEHGFVYPSIRTKDSIKKSFEVLCPISHEHNLQVVQTDEDSKIHPSSFYGLTKQFQEELLILACEIMDIPIFCLRFQNVYGPGQSLKNPYTGILSIFTRLALKGDTINIFEDGKESRDFVYINDVVNAIVLTLDERKNESQILNVGSGIPISVYEVAQQIVEKLGSSSDILISGDFREGDIRHNFADLTKIEKAIGYKPSWTFEVGLIEFLKWVRSQDDVPNDNFDYQKSLREMEARGLFTQKKLK